jgi:iron(III) transport system permease protein
MTTQIFASKQNGEMGIAMAETVALAVVALAGLALLRRTEGDDILVGIGKGMAPRRRSLRRPAVRAATTGLGWGLAVLLLLPHLTLILVSLVPYATWTTQTLPPVLSLVNYRQLFGEPARLEPLVNSLWMAAASTAGAVAIGLAAGWLVVRRRAALRRAIESLLALPWALPGTVFAIALATAFSASHPWQLRWVLVGTIAILPMAYLVRNLPVTGRAILAGYRQLDPALEEAAASLGTGAWGTLRRVTLPQLRPALAAGGSLAFVGALGDFVTSIILYTYENRPISMEINSALRVNEMGVAAAFGVILMLVSAAVLGIGARR